MVLAFGVLVGASSGLGYATAVRVAGTVQAGRGLALGLVVSAYAIGTALLTPIASTLLVTLGRAAAEAAAPRRAPGHRVAARPPGRRPDFETRTRRGTDSWGWRPDHASRPTPWRTGPGAHIYDPTNGGAILWQHLFWFFGHPEVYIVALPFFGIVTEVFPVFSRKPIFGYKTLIYATIAIGALSIAVWAHHMYATGAVLLPFFALSTYLIAVPTGIKFFNWIGTMWRGQLTFETPMLFAIGFLVTFLFGGLTGVLLASPPIDFHVTDSYFVVAHFHYVLFGTIVFATYAGIYFWFPKMTGRMIDERLGKFHFLGTFLGFHLTFLIQHWLGNEGMPRRYADYAATDGFTVLNTISTIGAFILGASTLPFIWNVFHSYRYGQPVEVDDPWGHDNSLEWATSCPPPRHNFTELPRIRSERPAFELHYPHLTERIRLEAHVGSSASSIGEAAAGQTGQEHLPGNDPRNR